MTFKEALGALFDLEQDDEGVKRIMTQVEKKIKTLKKEFKDLTIAEFKKMLKDAQNDF